MNRLNASGKPTTGHASHLLVPLAALLSISLTACAGGTMKGSYSEKSVQPVTVEKKDDGTAVIHFTMPGETMFYAGGVSYKVVGDELHVVIDRCSIQGECKTMAKTQIKQGSDWRTQVSVPFHEKRIVLIHADSTQQIYP